MNGEKLYFCCANCPKAFAKEPEKYISNGGVDKLGKRVRRRLGRAGFVEGCRHSCRRCKRQGAPREEKHPDYERRWCPQCGMLLWAKPLPRRFRRHDPPRSWCPPESWGLSGFWGLPEYPQTPYYRAHEAG